MARKVMQRRRMLLLASTSIAALSAAGAFTHAFANSAAQQLSAASLTAAANALHIPPVVTSPTASPAAQAQIALSAANLQRASQALSNLAAQQAAARAAAALTLNNVPLVNSGWNGTTLSGLQPLNDNDPTLWQGADPLQKDTATATATVVQTAENAVLTWRSFDLNTNETLVFDQPNASATVFNRIAVNPDGSRMTASPAEILGTVKANGAVYVYDPNGIIFGGSAQINVHSLIASALDVGAPTMTLAQRNAFFLDNGILDNNALSDGTVSFSFNPSDPSVEGDVVVQAGAVITASPAPASEAPDSGGFVYLFAPHVSNAGTIVTPAGETMMVAAEQISLTPNAYPEAGIAQTQAFRAVGVQFNDAANSLTNQSDHGSLGIAPQPWNSASALTSPGEVTNTGIIEADRGTVILNGDYVWQGGVIQADTSVDRNGSIFLDSRIQTTLTAASSTQILPIDDGSPFPLSSIGSFTPGQVELSGNTVDVEGLIEAPGGNVTVTGLPPATGVLSPTLYPAGIAFTTLGPTQAGQNPITANGITDPALPVEVRADPRILVGQEGTIDVSGLDDVMESVANNFITVKPNGNEFADQPLQRDGALLNQPLTFDIRQTGTIDGVTWVGTPLMDVSSYAGTVNQTIEDLLTTGGTIKLSAALPSVASGEVILQQGSVLNVSGGYIQYTGAYVSSTNLVNAEGQIVNIADASPLETYIGVAGETTSSDAHWGTSETFINPLLAGTQEYQPGYVEGRDAGGVTVAASAFVDDGTIVGGVVPGERQKTLGQISSYVSLNPADLRPVQLGVTPGSTTVQFNPQAMPTAGYLTITNGDNSSPVNFQINTNIGALTGPGFNAETPLAGISNGDVLSSPIAISTAAVAGLAQLSINTFGNVQVAAGADLAVQPGGVVSLVGNAVDVEGAITAHGGTIKAEAKDLNPGGNITLGSNAVLDASGLWVNDSGLDTGAMTGGAYINGGSIALITDTQTLGGADATGNIVFTSVTQADGTTQHSQLLASSGARLTQSGNVQVGSNGIAAGTGGNITLEIYNGTYAFEGTGGKPAEPTAGPPSATIETVSTDYSRTDIHGNPTVTTSATLASSFISAYGASQGGDFVAQAAGVQIGGALSTGAAAGTFYLPSSFFSSAGFSSYSLSAFAAGLAVEADSPQGSVLQLQQQNLVVTTALANLPTGADLASFAPLATLPEFLRTPVNLSLSANTEPYPYAATTPPQADVASAYPTLTAQPDLLIDQGVQIVGDPLAKISITVSGRQSTLGDPNGLVPQYAGQTGLGLILGQIIAPGGSITIANGTSSDSSFGVPPAQVWLGPQALLDTAGTVMIDPRQSQFKTGSVLAGGTVTVAMSSAGSSFVAQPGAMIDVSGAVGTLDLLQSTATGGGATAFVPTTVWSDAGTISLSAPTLLYAGGYLAQPGASEGNGGTLVLQTGSTTVGEMDVQQTGTILASAITPLGGFVLPGGTTVAGVSGDLTGHGVFDVSQLSGSGIANLTLSPSTAVNIVSGANGDSVTNAAYSPGTIAFNGNVDLSLSGDLMLDAAAITLPVSATASDVALDAAYIALRGGLLTAQTSKIAAPTAGINELDVAAQTIDIAGGVLNGVGQAKFTAADDIRLRVPYAVAANVSNGVFAAELLTSGNLTLTAARVYPVSDTDFTLKSLGSNGTITIQGNGNAALAALLPISVGGSVTLSAATVVQNGALRAPLGTIQLGAQSGAQTSGGVTTYGDLGSNDLTPFNFVATTQVTLGAGSVTSTSLDGVDLPFGETTDGQNWTYAANGTKNTTPLTAPPAQQLSLSGQNISMSPGANVDLSGGGDIFASEFVPGTGGSRDVLSNANYPNVYAILPNENGTIAPVDYDFMLGYGDTTPAPGASVYLSGGGGLAAGYYTLLPAHYAILPGAYRVELVANSQDALAANNSVLPDGTIQMAGSFANPSLGTSSARTDLFDVQSSAVWRQYSEIDQTSGTTYFAAQAAQAGGTPPPLPIDAGHFVLNALTGLNLSGQIDLAAAPGGIGAEVDIAGQYLQILPPGVTASATPDPAFPNYIGLSATQLSDLGADTLLIGGIRQGSTITPVANIVDVANNAASPLDAPDVMLVASGMTVTSVTGKKTNSTYTGGGVTLEDGSVVAAQGTSQGAAPSTLTLAVGPVNKITNSSTLPSTVITSTPLDSVLLSVSNGTPLSLTQASGQTPTATLAIGAATVSGNNLYLAAPNKVTVSNSATLAAKVIAASSQNINISDGTVNLAAASGFTVAGNVLAQLEQAQGLMLQGTTGINFYGNATLALSQPNSLLTLDGGALVAQTPGATDTVSASNITFVDSGVAAATGTGTANFDADAATIVFSNGSVGFKGFSAANFTATQQIATLGTGSVTAPVSALTFTTPLFLVGPESQQSISATGAVLLTDAGVGSGTPLATPALGGTLDITGGSIEANTLVEALSGGITLEATSGNVQLDTNAALDATGFAQSFFDVTRVTGGGTIQLAADNGNIRINQGATLDVSSPTGNPQYAGYAGQVSLNAKGDLSYVVNNVATSGLGFLSQDVAGDGGGKLAIDVGSLGGNTVPSAVSAIAVPGLFNNTVNIEVANGSLAVNSALTAQNVTLTADTGTIAINNATINASGAAGGTISIYGGQGVTLNGGTLLAQASDATQQGGAVTIGTEIGQVVKNGTTINSGNGSNAPGYIDLISGTIDVTNTANAANDGTVHLRAPLLPSGTDVAIDTITNATTINAGSIAVEAYKVYNANDGSGFTGTIDPIGNPGFFGSCTGTVCTGTLVSFVQNFGLSSTAQQKFASLDGNVQYQPGIELDNPNGAITVASNWNLGAGFITGPEANSTAITVAKNTTIAAGTTITNATGQLLAAYSSYAGAYKNTTAFTAVNGTKIAAGTTITNSQGQLLANYANYVGYLENAASFKDAAGGVVATAGTIVTDANGNLLPPYLGYSTASLAFVPDVTTIGSMVYRVGGSPTGAAPDLTIRAGGNLNIGASITDGFFETQDVFNSTYVTAVNNWVSANTADAGSGSATSGNSAAAYRIVGNYILAGALPNGGAAGALPIAAYNAAANGISPNAQSIAEADLFPLIASANGPITDSSGNHDVAMNSSSYNLVGGAKVTSANPLSLQSLTALTASPNGGSVTFSNQTSVKISGLTTYLLPTTVRTGTGTINVAAGLDVVLENSTNSGAPGVIYTGGRATPAAAGPQFAMQSVANPFNPSTDIALAVAGNPGGFLTPDILACTTASACNNGPMIGAEYPVAGGDITITAQRDITGSEQSKTDQQFFAPWLISEGSNLSNKAFGFFAPESDFTSRNSANSSGAFLPAFTPSQTSWWINFGSFDQGVMSVGGNVAVTAGRDIDQLSVSLPTTAYVSGGLSSQSVPVLNLNASGNLTVSAGRNINSSTFYEGSGTASIAAGGSIGSNIAATSQTSELSTLLAVDTGTIALQARGSVDLAGIVSGASLQDVSSTSGAAAVYLSSYGQESAVSVQSIGNATINSLTTDTILSSGAVASAFGGINLYPASFSGTSFLGSITVDSGFTLAPSATGSLSLLAQQNLTTTDANNVGNAPTADQSVISTGPSLVENTFDPTHPAAGFGPAAGSPVLDLGPLLLPSDAGAPDLFYAVDGSIVSGGFGTGQSPTGNRAADLTPIRWEVDRPADVEAGVDIVDLPFFGQNLAVTDVTTITAGRDLYYTDYSQLNVGYNLVKHNAGFPAVLQNASGLSLAGPGFFDISAGRNLGPFVTSASDIAAAKDSSGAATDSTGNGIITFGNEVTVGNRLLFSNYSDKTTSTASVANAFAAVPNSLLPDQGADIVANFGVGKGIDYQTVINAYLNPNGVSVNAGKYLPQLAAFLETLGVPTADATGDTWNQFEKLSANLQHVFVDQMLMDELKQAGISGEATGDYSAGYDILDMLFPAADGYTNNGTKGVGAAGRGETGDLNMLHAVIKTYESVTLATVDTTGAAGSQTVGGNIYLIGPGGNINVGSTAIELNQHLTNSSVGILTLGGGTINTFTDGSVNVDQSRVLTVLGGDIIMWSSNGDLDAGRGRKTTVDRKPLTVNFAPDDFQTINANGLITGAGIGTIQGTPETPPGNIFLATPHGTINFGAAGVRASGSLAVACGSPTSHVTCVINAANSTFTTSNLPPSNPTVDLGALESAGAAAGSASQAASNAAASAAARAVGAPSVTPVVWTGRVLGYGNCDSNDCDSP